MTETFQIISNYHQAFLSGFLVTLELSGITWLVGLSLGTTVGAMSYLAPRLVGWPVRGLAVVLAGIPFLVMLYWANYPLQEIFGIIVSPFLTAASLLSMINSVVIAEIWRGALTDFPREYIVAGRVTGLTDMQVLRWIQLPILFRQVLPGIIASQVAMLQLTLFSSLISVEELFRVSQEIDATIQKPIEIYTALALFFFFISAPLYMLAYFLRVKLTRDFSES